MVIRYIILAGMVGTASLAQAGPVNFGGLGGAVKSTFAVGATTKVGEFGRSDGAPASTVYASSPAPVAGAPSASPSNAPAPAPFAGGSGFNVGPADPSSLGNGGVTGGTSAPPPFANAAPAAPAAPAAAPAAAPRADEVAAETPALQAPVPSTPAADIGNAEELLAVLIPATGVPDADKLPTALAPLADPEAAVPEPATGFLMLAGLLGAGALSRRRKSSRQV